MTSAQRGPVVDFDLYDAAHLGDFTRCTAGLPPVSYTKANGGHWIVNRYDLIHRVLNDPDSFSSYPSPIPAESFGERRRMIPLELDPPEHMAYRKIILSHLAPAKVRELADGVRSLAKELLAQFSGTGEVEFAGAFARPFPALVFLRLMGMPEDRWQEFCGWVDQLYLGEATFEDDKGQTGDRARQQIYAYFEDFIARRRRDPAGPKSDITGVLLDARLPDGNRLSDEDLLDYMFLLLIAGLHTVEAALAFGVMRFCDHPEDRQRLIDEPDLMRTAVDEILRWAPVAWGTARRALKDVDLDGTVIHAGDAIHLPHQGANQDPRKFPEPERFDLARTPNPHASFGFGAHRCLGAHLARLEIATAFEEIHAAIPDYRMDESRQPSIHMAQVVGVQRLYLTFSPATVS